jgi:hypothetical protein
MKCNYRRNLGWFRFIARVDRACDYKLLFNFIGTVPIITYSLLLLGSGFHRYPSSAHSCNYQLLTVRAQVQTEVKVLEPVGQSVCWSRTHLGPQDHGYITGTKLGHCWYEALSLTRERACRIKLLLVLASAVILGFESHDICNHISLLDSNLPQPTTRSRVSIPQEHSDPIVTSGTRFTTLRSLCYSYRATLLLAVYRQSVRLRARDFGLRERASVANYW